MESSGYQQWAQQIANGGPGSAAAFQPPKSEHEIAVARDQMYESVAHFSSSLRNAAAQCDNFIKTVARYNPGAAAAHLKNMPTDLLALSGMPSSANGQGGGSGSAKAAAPAAAAPRATKVPRTPAAAPAAAPTSAETPATPATASVGRKSLTKEQKAENRKERKAKRDPLAPKRPPSAYLLFQNEIRDEMRARHTELSYSEVLGKVSEAWKELGDDQKRIYQEKTLEAMQKWNDDKASYLAMTGAAATPSDQQEDEDEVDEGEAQEAAVAAGGTLDQAFATTSQGTKRKAAKEAKERSPKKDKKPSRH